MTEEFKATLARYEAAFAEMSEAAKVLRELLRVETKQRFKEGGRPRRSWEEAEIMAHRVRALHADKPKLTQRALGKQLGLTRDLVSYYLSPRCKLGPRGNKTAS